MLLVVKKVIKVVGLNANQQKFTISVICKNVIENFVTIYNITLKRINDIVKEAKCNFIKQNC